MRYEVFFKNSVWKDFKPIPKKDLENILEFIHSLSENPRPPGCKKMSGQEHYRYRIGRYRIIYSIQDQQLTVWVIKFGHRKDVYRST